MTFLPTGGIYVTGGMAIQNIEWILCEESCFMKAYYDKGRASSILDDIPLFLVMIKDMGLRGAAKCAELVRLCSYKFEHIVMNNEETKELT